MKNLIYITLSIITLQSCVSEKRCLEKFGDISHEVKSDSVRIERVVEYRDTIIEIPGASSVVSVNAPCDTNGILKDFQKSFKDKTGKSTVTVKGSNNTITAECECEGENLIIKKQKERIREFEAITSTKKNTATLTKTKSPWWAKWWLYPVCAIIGWICGALGVHKLIWKLIKGFF